MHRTFALVIFVSICCFVSFIYTQEKYGCQKNECAKYTCKPDIESTCNGRLIRNGSLLQCGCCHVCVEYLERGAECVNEKYSALPRDECGEGLTCKSDKDPKNKTNICDYANMKCVQAQLEFKGQQERAEGYTMGIPEPKCDTFGDYQPVQCKEGMKCYCVDLDGHRIFGLAPYSERSTMNCTCSRDYETFKRYMKDPDEPNQFMRCAPNGDYYHTQCTDDKCYCVDKTGALAKPPINKQDIGKLMCADDIVDDFNTSCIVKYMETMKIMEEFNGPVVGIEPPSCDLDGSYSPVQCEDFECFCVNKQGQRTTKSIIVRNSEEARKMTCGCLREKALLEVAEQNVYSEMLAQYKCAKNGNYLPVQCTKAVCFCVDEIEGFQIGSPILVGNRHNLTCFREEYNEILNIIFD